MAKSDRERIDDHHLKIDAIIFYLGKLFSDRKMDSDWIERSIRGFKELESGAIDEVEKRSAKTFRSVGEDILFHIEQQKKGKRDRR